MMFTSNASTDSNKATIYSSTVQTGSNKNCFCGWESFNNTSEISIQNQNLGFNVFFIRRYKKQDYSIDVQNS